MGKQAAIARLLNAVAFAILVVADASVAVHAQTINGGGSTLAQPLYRAEMPSNWQYGSVGSGAGRLGFFNDDMAQDLPGMTGKVHFGASDAAITVAEYNAYIAPSGKGNVGSSSGDGRLIQIPMMITPIVIYNKTASGTRNVVLTKSELCGIFSGHINNWNQIHDPAGPVGVKFPAEPITVIYRAESSGTTTLLTQHLASVCATAETGGVVFKGRAVFADEFGDDDGEAPLPSNFVPATGSFGVQNALDDGADTSAFAYLSPDPLYQPLSSVSVALLENSHVFGASYSPSREDDVRLAMGVPAAPDGTVITNPLAAGYTAVTNPAYPINWVKAVSDPADGYPIVGTTNLLVSQCYSGARIGSNPNPTEAALIGYLNYHFDPSNEQQIRDHGFVPLDSAYVSAIVNRFLAGVDVLKIGNSTYCNTVAGR